MQLLKGPEKSTNIQAKATAFLGGAIVAAFLLLQFPEITAKDCLTAAAAIALLCLALHFRPRSAGIHKKSGL
jgi:hypothetical protein